MLVWVHAFLALACVALMARQSFTPRQGRSVTVLISLALAAAMASGLWIMMLRGGLAHSLFFGHVMHWLGWLAVLTWLHAMVRPQPRFLPTRSGLPLLVTCAACIAGLLSLVQERI